MNYRTVPFIKNCLVFMGCLILFSSETLASTYLEEVELDSGYRNYHRHRDYIDVDAPPCEIIGYFDECGSMLPFFSEAHIIDDWNVMHTHAQQGLYGFSVRNCGQEVGKSDYKVYGADDCRVCSFSTSRDSGMQCYNYQTTELIMESGFVRKNNCPGCYEDAVRAYGYCGLQPPGPGRYYTEDAQSSYTFRVTCQEETMKWLYIETSAGITSAAQPSGGEFSINGVSPTEINQRYVGYDECGEVYYWGGELKWHIPAKCGETVTLTPSLTTGYGYASILSVRPIFEQCEDKDGDGHYAISASCSRGDDCDDNDPEVYPGAKEICDGKDNDCNGIVDDLCPALPMPLFKQCSSPWGTDIYDHIASTICKKGCALTSAVMVLRYYGVTTGIDGKEVNPRNLNEWLKNQPEGYTGPSTSWVNWREIARYSGGRIIYSGSSGRNDRVLNDDLCKGRPAIVNVPNHFVVATGAMCVDSETTWTINDPGRNITTLQGYGNDYLGLRRFRPR